jgi:HlyD family secretion protein
MEQRTMEQLAVRQPTIRQSTMNRTWIVRSLIIAALFIVSCVSSGCSSNEATGPITASGYIEGEQVIVAPEVSGRVVEVHVDRGDAVQAGDVLARLDDAVLQSQRREAEAGAAGARANLARVLAGARSDEIAGAEAALRQAEAARDGAARDATLAREEIADPQSLEAEIDAARTQVHLAEQNAEMARADLAEAEMLRNYYAAQGGDTERRWNLLFRAAEAALAASLAELEGAQRVLDLLLETHTNPLVLYARLHAAETQDRIAGARVAATQATLDELRFGPTAEEAALAEAQVRQAEAAVRLADARIAQLTLTAPMTGIVTTRGAHAGETATAGVPLLTIANLDEMTLVIYVPVTRIGHVRLGQEVDVRVDSFPGRTFPGQVAGIAGEAEFTPRNVQTQEERVNLVFAVDVRIPNPEGALKPGMPADATLRP